MSTVFYGYRCRRDQLWEIRDAAEKWYRREAVFGKMLQDFLNKNPLNQSGGIKKLRGFFELADDEKVDFQVFEAPDNADEYIISVLESGYQFQTLTKTERFPRLEEFNYDNRVETFTDDDPRSIVINQLAEMTKNKHYFMVSVINPQEILNDIITEQMVAAWSKQ